MMGSRQTEFSSGPLKCCVCRSVRTFMRGTGLPICSNGACLSEYYRLKQMGTPVCLECGVYLNSPRERCERFCSVQCRSQYTTTQLIRDSQSYAAKIQEQIDVKLEQLDCRNDDAAPVIPAIIPHNDYLLSQVSDERLETFRTATFATIQDAFRQHPDVPTELPEEDHGERMHPETVRLVAEACSTCRGWCCRYGADRHAFIDVSTIQRYRVNHPTASAEEILAVFMMYAAGESFQGSCIYQGANGCRLPQPLRSAVCNRFLCDGVRTLIQLGVRSDVPVMCIAAVSGTVVHDVRVLDRVS
ncbi:MAG: hypothetical protein JNL58_10120 [Planctomyces sp.]|nr:hypothetical protein [Planctomyces sp.]